ncbi:MAG: CBS domain-containing protein [Verrucomicrobiota bacterium]|jgi:CBS domain-containing protein
MKMSVPISTVLHHKNPKLWTVSPEATVFEAVKLMAEKDIGALPVMSGDRLAGLFTERDYARKIVLYGKSSKETRVREIISSKVVTITPGDFVEECMKLMTENRVRHLPVLQDEKLIGIISIGDLVNWTISAQDAAISQMEQYIAGSTAA